MSREQSSQASQQSQAPVTGRCQPPAKTRRALIWRLVRWGTGLSVLGAVAAAGVLLWAVIYFGRDLPDYRQLAKYEPAIITRIHAGDGSLLREYAVEPRLFIPIGEVPPKLIEAFLAAEDKNFYAHSGLDYTGIVRAGLTVVWNKMRGSGRLVGASTITQQVARNFLLTLDQKWDRKIKEMILSLRIERAFTKDQILELYLNEINLGNRSYGVAAAALNYFNKSLDELTIGEMAFLAALPKAPHNYHPVRKRDRAIARRNWVLSRMEVNGFITADDRRDGQAEDLQMQPRTGLAKFEANHFAEEVRRRLSSRYGKKALYEGGLSVRTTLEPALQTIAERELRRGLVAYDRRHGWRGAFGRLNVVPGWPQQLASLDLPLGIETWEKALVLEVRADGAIIGLSAAASGGAERYGYIPFSAVAWARAWRTGERLGPAVGDMGEVLALGDVIAVERRVAGSLVDVGDYWTEDGALLAKAEPYDLRQIPDVEGALIAMDPHTGRVLALVGGYDFDNSQYNRATQAQRQPGSAFKPFVYAAGLDNGFTPASLVLDAPFVIEQGYGLGKWKPKNSTNKFYGPSTLRLGIEKSRNLMTVRLAQHLGMDVVTGYAERFGLAGNMQTNLADSLGASEVTLLQLTAAYAMLVNGGRRVDPVLIDRIQDRRGRTIERSATTHCRGCTAPWSVVQLEPALDDLRDTVLSPQTAYQLVSMLEGVVTSGTGRKIRAVAKPLAGKTGTTNDAADAWFVGFSPDLVVGVFVGFDQPRSLGRYEEGSSVAVPIFRDFMQSALRGKPGVPFRVPSGVRLVRINRATGLPAAPGDKDVILEAFKFGTEPNGDRLAVLDGSAVSAKNATNIRKGSGGIY